MRFQLSKVLLICVGLLFATSAHSETNSPDRVNILLGSKHINFDPSCCDRTSWNEVNPGVVLTWENRWVGLNYSAGVYINSFQRPGLFSSVSKTWKLNEETAVSAVLGLADYGENAKYVNYTIGNAAIVPSVQLNYRNIFVQAIPAPQKSGLGAIFTAGLSFPLK